MEILDIVHRAVQRSSIFQGFNPAECPEDIEERASDVLVHEMIPALNNDRTLDLTETTMIFTPGPNGVLDLSCPPSDGKWFILTLPYDSQYLMEQDEHGMYSNLIQALNDIGMTDSQPTDPLGGFIPLGIWSSDMKFITTPAVDIHSLGPGCEPSINRIYNVPFPPMRVEGVVESSTGCELDYKHALEFISAEFRHARMVYMYEVYENKVRLRFHHEYGNLPVELVLPVPITVVNYLDSPKPWSGKIIAPPKFREFLIAKLAYRLAKELGVASAAELKTDTAEAYNLLVKNYPKQQHATDFNKRISDVLRRPVNTIVSSAGFYGGTNG